MSECKENEISAWTVAVGNYNPLMKRSRKAVKRCMCQRNTAVGVMNKNI